MALSVETQEAIWLRHLQEDTGPTLIFVDNQGAISMAKNPVFHKRMKHIQIRYHFVREAVEQGTIVKYIDYVKVILTCCDSAYPFTAVVPYPVVYMYIYLTCVAVMLDRWSNSPMTVYRHAHNSPLL